MADKVDYKAKLHEIVDGLTQAEAYVVKAICEESADSLEFKLSVLLAESVLKLEEG